MTVLSRLGRRAGTDPPPGLRPREAAGLARQRCWPNARYPGARCALENARCAGTSRFSSHIGEGIPGGIPSPLKLLMGFEPMTSSLPRRRSTTELQQRLGRGKGGPVAASPKAHPDALGPARGPLSI